jgi:hypothetical protein
MHAAIPPSFDAFHFMTNLANFHNTDFSYAFIRDIVTRVRHPSNQPLIPGPLSFYFHTLLIGIISRGERFGDIQAPLLAYKRDDLVGKLAMIERETQLVAAPPEVDPALMLPALVKLAGLSGESIMHRAFSEKAAQMYSNMKHRMAVISIVNQTSYVIEREDWFASAGQVVGTFPHIDPAIRCFGNPLYSVGIHVTSSGHAHGLGGAISGLKLRINGIAIVIAAASSMLYHNTILVSLNGVDTPGSLGERNERTEGAQTFEGTTEGQGTNIRVEASVEPHLHPRENGHVTAIDVCHARVIIKEIPPSQP